MYLREMGNVELLSREGEIAIAKELSPDMKPLLEDYVKARLQHRFYLYGKMV